MKTIYLVRHAKSSWDDPFQDDFDRPLNERGRTDAPRMARRLKEKEIHPDLLLSSPAARAISTCKVIAETAGYHHNQIKTDSRLYHASEETLLQIVKKLSDEIDVVMIFAHNPGLTDFANRLLPEPFTNNIPTCGITGIQFDISSWQDVQWGNGEIHFFDYPKSRKN